MIIPLIEATSENAGPKAAALAHLIRAGFPVPPAFVIPTAAAPSATTHPNPSNTAERPEPFDAAGCAGPSGGAGLGLSDVSRLGLFGGGEGQRGVVVPGWLVGEVAGALEVLGGGAVAVRSSGSGEDGVVGSAAGQYDSYLAVEGVDAVVDKVQLVWGSLWSRRAVAYRLRQPERTPEIAVIVQRLVDAEVAGVLFTADPRTPGGAAVVEASWGLGESVVQGLVTPDSYVVQADGEIDRRCGSKAIRRDRGSGGDGGGVVSSEVPVEQREALCLGDEQVRRIVRLGQEVAELMGGPQDIEFALENDRVWLLQARPITAPLDATEQPLNATEQPRPTDDEPVLRGVAGSPGTATGPARLVRGVEDFGQVEAGDILVCPFTDPAWTPLFGVVAGVVTEIGGRLSHAAIVAREHRIPAVLGVSGVMSALEDGQMVTVVGNTGVVNVPDLSRS
ncbi:PEP/pyruvate-binding domain-containing protein [Kribbella sp. NPDC051620]|uniref:PEP/pyruvate-binding domain-containing protein n=1 Tax=Kribbella sp. NPDC051620 TaxID=3364120 RepID=UPI0037938336